MKHWLRDKFVLLAISGIYTTILLYLSLSRLPSGTIQFQYQDKAHHLIAYFGLFILWLIYLISTRQYNKEEVTDLKTKKLVYLTIYCAGFGMLMEVFQSVFTNYRVLDLYDICANCIGVIIAYLSRKFWIKIYNRLLTTRD